MNIRFKIRKKINTQSGSPRSYCWGHSEAGPSSQISYHKEKKKSLGNNYKFGRGEGKFLSIDNKRRGYFYQESKF